MVPQRPHHAHFPRSEEALVQDWLGNLLLLPCAHGVASRPVWVLRRCSPQEPASPGAWQTQASAAEAACEAPAVTPRPRSDRSARRQRGCRPPESRRPGSRTLPGWDPASHEPASNEGVSSKFQAVAQRHSSGVGCPVHCIAAAFSEHDQHAVHCHLEQVCGRHASKGSLRHHFSACISQLQTRRDESSGV